MKLIHLSDIHLGKRVNEFSMMEDQRDILSKILRIIEEEEPDGVLVAGDIYDKSIPSEDAMRLWDHFLNQLAGRHVQVFVISGNHDSGVRLSEHASLIEGTGIHIAPVYDGHAASYKMEDAHGDVWIHLLPFIKPSMVRAFFPDEEIEDYTDACRAAIAQMKIDEQKRNVLIAHQFVTGAQRCESEEASVGGMDQVDVSILDAFDYVALGHLHGPQRVGRDSVRYCGTPLKYSFSEKDHKKTVTIVELHEKGAIEIRERELIPMHDMREISGSYKNLMTKENYEGTELEDYIHAVLTDEQDVPDAAAKLRMIYPNLMKLSYNNARTRENREWKDLDSTEKKTPLELFEEFYKHQNNQPMNADQSEWMETLIRSIWEE